MAIFSAWCDRQPVLIFGATGPLDAVKRRPWIDWIHTTIDQAGMIRNFIKWDAQPASAAAAIEALLRANMIARTAPKGPVFITLDVGLQEQELETAPAIPDVSRFQPPPAPSAESVAAAASLLAAAQKPVMLVGRCANNEAAWRARIALAEALGARVFTDLKAGSAFPSTHPLHELVEGDWAETESRPERAAEFDPVKAQQDVRQGLPACRAAIPSLIAATSFAGRSILANPAFSRGEGG